MNPTTQKLVCTDYANTPRSKSHQAASISLSMDGLTLATGGPLNDGGIGCTWVFTREHRNSTWIQQGNKLVGYDFTGLSEQGASVSLSSDGNTLVVGAPGDDGGAGATWIFTRIENSWLQLGKKLTAITTGKARQGATVTISGDGKTLVVAGPEDGRSSTSAGFKDVTSAAWTFAFVQDRWIEQGFKLQGYHSTESSKKTRTASLSLSYDGTTLAFGSYYPETSRGQISTYKRNYDSWTEIKTEALNELKIGNDRGNSVSLSGDGNVLAVGAYDEVIGCRSLLFKFLDGDWVRFQDILVGGKNSDNRAYRGPKVVLSYDGLTVSIAAPLADNQHYQSTWNYRRCSSTANYVQLNSVPSDSIYDKEGVILALSGDGQTVATGSPLSDDGIGKGLVYDVLSVTREEIVAIDYLSRGRQGHSVAISGNGTTIAISAPRDNNAIGATSIFILSSTGVWIQQGGKLVGKDYVGPSHQGASVALSYDGCLLAVGGYGDDSGVGATWLFARVEGKWSQVGQKLIGSGYRGKPNQGTVVALDGKGLFLAVSGPTDNSGLGAVWVFEKSGSEWVQKANKITVYNDPQIRLHGNALSLSPDGNSLAISYSKNGDASVRVLRRKDRMWKQQGRDLLFKGSSVLGSLSLSEDGNVLAVGDPVADDGVGAVWMVGVEWAVPVKLVGRNSHGASRQGTSVALSYNGEVLASGAPLDAEAKGSVWIFRKGVQVEEAKVASATVGNGLCGFSVALSCDGKVLVAGIPSDRDEVGAACCFLL